MIRKILLLTALVSVPVLGASKAQANDEYCREYTKIVRIGGRSEQAYGMACYKPDGSWEIVTLEGSDYGRNKVREVIYDDIKTYRRPVRTEKVVTYNHSYKPRYVRSAYRSPILFNFGYHNGHKYYDKHSKKPYKKHYKKSHYDHGRENKRGGRH
jgi:hypothetical protein